MDILFYAWKGDDNLPSLGPPPLEGASVEVWRPAPGRIFPPLRFNMSSIVWWAFHFLMIFANRDYGVIYIKVGGAVAHSAIVTPRYFRFPFMEDADVQIGATWTSPEHRGRGLAKLAIRSVCKMWGAPTVWYLTEARNAASVRAVEGAGFKLLGAGTRRSRFGLKAFGYYRLSEMGET